MRVSRQRCFNFRHSRKRQPKRRPRRASSTLADIRWITRLIGIGGLTTPPFPYGGSGGLGSSLDAEEQTAMHDALHHTLTTVAPSDAHLYFGICQDCVCLGGETCCSSTSSPLRPAERTGS